jgi:hypothetical protein
MQSVKLSFKINCKSAIMSTSQDSLVINVTIYKVDKGSIPHRGGFPLYHHI